MAAFAVAGGLSPVSGGESGCRLFRLRSAGFDGFLKHGVGALAHELIDEMARLRWLAPHVGVPQVVHFECSMSEAWLLTTTLPGTTAFEALRASPDDCLAIVDEIASFLRRLHAIPVESCPFDSGHQHRIHQARIRIDQGLVAVDDFDSDRAGWSAEQVWEKMLAKLPLSPDAVVTHGDFTLDNVIVDETKVVGCIDVGRAGVADRYQDLALMWSYLEEFGPVARQRFLNTYGVAHLDDDKLRFHLELDEFF